MENKPKINQEILDKYKFVKYLGDVVTAIPSTTVVDVRYEYWVHNSNPWHQEKVVVEFKGGAIEVRNVSGDSCTAIFQEVGKLISGGYYDEVQCYETMRVSGDWTPVDLLNNETYEIIKED